MEPIVVASLGSLALAVAVLLLLLAPFLRKQEATNDAEPQYAKPRLSPWEVDQQLPDAPRDLLAERSQDTREQPQKSMTTRDVPDRYPESRSGAHRQMRDFGAPTSIPGPRHRR